MYIFFNNLEIYYFIFVLDFLIVFGKFVVWIMVYVVYEIFCWNKMNKGNWRNVIKFCVLMKL